MFFTFICVLCKKMAVAIAMNIISPLVITLIATLADSLIKSDTIKVANFWLDGMINNISSLAATSTSVIIAIVGAVLYSAIFVFFGAMISKDVEA